MAPYIWKPTDRDRRFLILRYKTQYFQAPRGSVNLFSAKVLGRLSLETRELTEPASYQHIKEIVTHSGIAKSI